MREREKEREREREREREGGREERERRIAVQSAYLTNVKNPSQDNIYRLVKFSIYRLV